jgi:uncharacterized membrane protein YhaH (DUF805 family)
MASSVQGQVQALASRQKVQLVAGAVAGPLFVAVSLAQIPFRDGFDMTRHAFSFLLNGPGGWLQTINFVVTGALFLLTSPGLRAGLGGRAGVVAGVLLGIVGCGLVVAGLFAPQPSYGYPPGAPDGMPTNLTASSIMHGIAFITAVLAYCATLAVTAWRLRQLGDLKWAGVCGGAAVILLAIPATQATGAATVVIYIAVTAAFLATSGLMLHLRRAERLVR